MRPIALKAHERPVTSIKYNTDGDLLFTASKHKNIAVWYTNNGERLGTYHGHNGSIWSVDIDRHTDRILSGSADSSAKLWDVQTGRELLSWAHKAPVRSVNWSLSEKQFLTVSDAAMGHTASIYIWDVSVDPSSKIVRPVMEIPLKSDFKIQQAMWGPLNDNVITACEDGTIRVFDVRKGAETNVISEHSKAVMSISYNKTKTMFISASVDGTSKLFDSKTFKCLKTYHTGRPINGSSISPDDNFEVCILAGGQKASDVTTTRVDNAQFRVRFYHLIYQEELGSVPGHFGPVNSLAFSPDGKGFSSGGEDGYVRLHHFDNTYFNDFSKESFANKKKFMEKAVAVTKATKSEDNELED